MNKKSNLLLLLTSFFLLGSCSSNSSSNDNTQDTNSNSESINSDSTSSTNESSTSTSSGSLSTSSSSSGSSSSSSSASSSNTSSSSSSSSTSQPVEEDLDAYTIMIYMCGSDLESDSSNGGLATANLKEIMSVSLPSNVNVIIETGGAKSWKISGISSSKLGRYAVENKKLVLKESLTKANMGSSSTLQSFVEWGLNNYPAEKTGFIFWNHGGAMLGVCSDENYDYDSLLNSEVNQAFSKAFASTNRTSKLEWVGYDACLMQVQDIADFNSNYFNYMVASQESEPGEGWDYDVWLNTLAKNVNISTEDLLKSLTDSYVSKCATIYNSYGGQYRNYNDATLSVLDLSKMSEYKNEFESFASQLSSKSLSKSKFKSLVNGCNQFGYVEDDYGSSGEFVFDVVDVGDYISSVESTFSIDTSSLANALDNLVIYNKYGKDKYEGGTRTVLSGLCLFAATTGNSNKTDYSTSETNFTTWRTINMSYGSFYSY